MTGQNKVALAVELSIDVFVRVYVMVLNKCVITNHRVNVQNILYSLSSKLLDKNLSLLNIRKTCP